MIQDPREDGHTIQHQGGHLKIALRTPAPNSTLFGELGSRKWGHFVGPLVPIEVTLAGRC